MFRARWLLVAAAALVPATQAEAQSLAAANALDSLVAAERAFSAYSVEHGTKAAFLAFLDDDAIVFSPGPVNAHKLWSARSKSDNTLIWGPAFSEVSAAGDLGLSLGPFEVRTPGNDTPVLEGHFISVWGRGEGEPWRVWIDMGSVHAAPASGVDDIEFVAGPEHPEPPKFERPGFGWSVGGAVYGGAGGLGLGIGSYVAPRYDEDAIRAHAIHEMMTAERTLAYEMRGEGAGRALLNVAAEDVRVFRSGVPPAVGVDAAIEAAGDKRVRVKWVPKGRVVSRSWDLGYSYGLSIRRANRSAKPDSGAYLHVWRKIGPGGWQLVVDVENPFAQR